jgi:hypothetical protein
LPFALLLLVVCSPVHEPEPQGTISLKLYIESAPGGDVKGAPVQNVPDSAAVRVFRPGTGVVQEVSQGAAVNGAAAVDLTVTCAAETGKKVSVELYSGGTMIYFGVDENVDVVENENTDVTIDAYDIHVDDVEVTDALIEPGDPPLDVYWDPVPAAESYLLLESSSPNFEQQLTQSFLTTDTVMTRNRPAGPWYYAVAPLNPYAVGSISNVAYAYVVSAGEQPPGVDGMDPQEVAPGDRVTLTGNNLNVPGRVWVGTVTCPVVSASETELEFTVPRSAYTGAVSFENLMNTVGVPGILVVDRIAYVTRTDRDASDSQWYTDLVEGESRLNTGVAVIPLGEVADRDLTVFDVIVIAHDVGSGQFAADPNDLRAIARSGANVLAIGGGGQAFFEFAIADFDGLAFTGRFQQGLYFPNGSLPLLQSPYQITPSDGTPSDQLLSSVQYYTGVTLPAPVASVTTYAALARDDDPLIHVLLDAVTTSPSSQQVHNIYWGFRGDPTNHTGLGQACVANMLIYLYSTKTVVPGTPARALP